MDIRKYVHKVGEIKSRLTELQILVEDLGLENSSPETAYNALCIAENAMMASVDDTPERLHISNIGHIERISINTMSRVGLASYLAHPTAPDTIASIRNINIIFDLHCSNLSHIINSLYGAWHSRVEKNKE